LGEEQCYCLEVHTGPMAFKIQFLPTEMTDVYSENHTKRIDSVDKMLGLLMLKPVIYKVITTLQKVTSFYPNTEDFGI
jgi:hypothetical protein